MSETTSATTCDGDIASIHTVDSQDSGTSASTYGSVSADTHDSAEKSTSTAPPTVSGHISQTTPPKRARTDSQDTAGKRQRTSPEKGVALYDHTDVEHITAQGVMKRYPRIAENFIDAMTKNLGSKWRDYTKKTQLIASIRTAIIRPYRPMCKLRLYAEICESYGGPKDMAQLFMPCGRIDIDLNPIEDPRLRAVKNNIRIVIWSNYVWQHIKKHTLPAHGITDPDSYMPALVREDAKRPDGARKLSEFDVTKQMTMIREAAEKILDDELAEEIVDAYNPLSPHTGIPFVVLDTLIVSYKMAKKNSDIFKFSEN